MTEPIYIIERGFKEGKALTTAQKSSALFAEEPVVLGKVLRRGSRPMKITGADYRANEMKLLRLESAGAIVITRPVAIAEEPKQEQTAPPPPPPPEVPPEAPPADPVPEAPPVDAVPAEVKTEVTVEEKLEVKAPTTKPAKPAKK